MDGDGPLQAIEIDACLIAQAEAHAIDVRYVCERAIRRALPGHSMSADEYYAANKGAIDRFNAWIAENGMPYEKMHADK